ncbi:MAG: hypothetical protein CYPHOPRED_001300 [Cyphobasidiales sp. Tagirdzhanova-0007]|nr:MAG: hypothetical protein CYPHOPRED_001300 [Cyphobasidiales sp. Tagirdzhanova-0007]
MRSSIIIHHSHHHPLSLLHILNIPSHPIHSPLSTPPRPFAPSSPPPPSISPSPIMATLPPSFAPCFAPSIPAPTSSSMRPVATTPSSPIALDTASAAAVNPPKLPLPQITALSRPAALKRAPSLSELVQTMRSHNPEKWDKLSKLDLASPANILNSMSDSPRLRLPARLAAKAPSMVRSQSSNAIIQAIPPFQSTHTATPSASSSSSSLSSSSTATITINSENAAKQRMAGVPSLEVIEKRFANKNRQGTDSRAVGENHVGILRDVTPLQANSSLAPNSTSMSRSKSDGCSTSPSPSVTISSLDLSSRSSSITSSGSHESSKENTKPLSYPVPPSLHSSFPSPLKTPATPALPSLVTYNKDQEHPLEHPWTLYYDSRSTQLAAKQKANCHSISSPALPPASTNSWEAALSNIGTFHTVESFCRLFNWTKKPSRMGMNENLHLFKQGIRPMWEDDANLKGGKWTLNIDWSNKEGTDRAWKWLCLALIGEDFEGKDDSICGAVLSTRPRIFRIQLWLKDKEDITAVNGIGKRLIRLLELDDSSHSSHLPPSPTSPILPTEKDNDRKKTGLLSTGISLEFAYHTKGLPPPNNFISLDSPLLPQAQAEAEQRRGSPAPSTGGGGRILLPSNASSSSHFNRPSSGFGMGSFGGVNSSNSHSNTIANGNTNGGSAMSRAATMSSLASHAGAGTGRRLCTNA